MEAIDFAADPAPAPLRALPTAPVVRVAGDRIVVERLVLTDAALAAALAERDEADRAAIVERALRIGLIAIQDAVTSVDTDVVRREFEKLMEQTSAANQEAARTLEEVLRANFADGDGRLPRTLERFLGDKGALKTLVDELFDETRRDSAIGRIGGAAGPLLRRRQQPARPAARPDAARIAAPPVPPGDVGRVPPPPRAPRRDRGRQQGPRGRAVAFRGEGRRLRGAARGDAGRAGPGRRRPDRADRHGHGLARRLEEGRLRRDARPAGDPWRGRPRGARGEGPGDVAAGHARGAPRGAREPRRGGRRRDLVRPPRARRDRAVRGARRGRPRGDRPRGAGPRVPRGGRPARPAARPGHARRARGGGRRAGGRPGPWPGSRSSSRPSGR